MLIAPFTTKKDFLSKLNNSELIVVACPEPKPGKKEKNGEIKNEARIDFKSSFFVNMIEERGCIICFSIFVEEFNEMNRDEIPNKPESKGNKGSFTGRLNVKKPNNPDREKIIRLVSNFSSLNIK